jgi:hypothetical protein
MPDPIKGLLERAHPAQTSVWLGAILIRLVNTISRLELTLPLPDEVRTTIVGLLRIPRYLLNGGSDPQDMFRRMLRWQQLPPAQAPYKWFLNAATEAALWGLDATRYSEELDLVERAMRAADYAYLAYTGLLGLVAEEAKAEASLQEKLLGDLLELPTKATLEVK